MTYEEVYESIKNRDENDKKKEIGALKIAEDSIIVDTTSLSIDEVVDKIIKIIIEFTCRIYLIIKIIIEFTSIIYLIIPLFFK